MGLNSSLSVMATLKKIALYVLWINFKGPPKSEVSNVCDKILRFVDLQPLDPKFHLALEPKVLKLKVLSFGNRPSIYV